MIWLELNDPDDATATPSSLALLKTRRLA